MEIEHRESGPASRVDDLLSGHQRQLLLRGVHTVRANRNVWGRRRPSARLPRYSPLLTAASGTEGHGVFRLAVRAAGFRCEQRPGRG
ncbi:hypothetical protein [Streptomyces sp. 7N604]|uniref:hypothetical protein n=1 Tax=Streptomyces sp. 7N604 TaxID=3457415 RepID=UPI003FD66239